MDKVLAFCLGILLYWFITGFTQDELAERMKSVWKDAYMVGKEDGYIQGKSEYAYMQTREWLSAKCMLFNWDEEAK